jgi:hypothetical protein|nr:hypothetical protein [uncultured Pseudoxanthomonas sp.]
MTNPHSTDVTDIDIRAVADRVIAQMRQGQPDQALHLLETERQGERRVVQEALDRYVSVGARAQIDEIHQSGGLRSPEFVLALERLRQAGQPPRVPDYNGREINQPNELVGLTNAQKFDVYASIVEARGSQAASDALQNEESVLLGLRKETSTLASMGDRDSRGTGVYDDHIVVLRKQANGERHVFIADRASTEPTAQYDERAQPGPRRENTPYANVAWRRSEGEDVNRDGISDMGRLAEGTIEMADADHPNPRLARTTDAFRPSAEQLRAPRDAHRLQRDSNGDGWFTHNDINGVQDLNRSFKIHSGSRANTDSAGCQTIHPEDYLAFNNAARANPQQTRWQYVLTSTEGGLFHDVNRGGEQEQEPRQLPLPQRPDAPADDRQGRQRHELGSSDSSVDRYLAAVMSGDSAAADRAATEFARSAEGRHMEAQGSQWLAQHQAAEQAQSQDRQMAR